MRTRSVASCVLALAMLFPAAGCSEPKEPGRQPPPAAVPETAPDGGAADPGTTESGTADPGAVAEGKLLFEQKCGVCHQLERTAYRRETREDWTRIVKDMQSKQKGWISDPEAARIIEYLATAQGK